MKIKVIGIIVSFFLGCTGGEDLIAPTKHLYVLSGQSNMERMPVEYFSDNMPEDSIVIKYAVSGTSIVEWVNGLYQGILDRLPSDYDTVTLVWMQGERDAINNMSADEYKTQFRELFETIGADRLVMGRIGVYFSGSPIRQAQVELADEYNGEWVDTDDLGEDLHYDDYETLGKRFAEACRRLLAAV